MGNKIGSYKIYRPSAIRDILRSARERSVNPNMRTKKALAEALGTTTVRLTGMEDGTSQIPMEMAFEWCVACEDKIAWEMIKHTYGEGPPPTDPRLIKSLDGQLHNFNKQAVEAIDAIKGLLEISRSIRPGRELGDSKTENIYALTQQIFDMIQATNCVLDSLNQNLGLEIEEVERRWTQKALSDGVIVPSTQHYDEIKRMEISI